MDIGIAGISGRMGQALKEAIEADARVTLAAASSRAAQPALINVSDYTPDELVAKCDAVIDFTTPNYTLRLAAAASEQSKIHIIGTTGFSDGQMLELKEYGKTAAIVCSGNMSLGVNLMSALVEKAASVLGVEYDIEIDEFHHKHKKDAPSGTALLLGRSAAKGRGVELEDVKNIYAEGVTSERKEGTIGFSIRRGGDVVGEHEVAFAGPGEVLSITHKGFSRQIYARGAISAALWAKDQKPGFYSMKDVLA